MANVHARTSSFIKFLFSILIRLVILKRMKKYPVDQIEAKDWCTAVTKSNPALEKGSWRCQKHMKD